MDEIVIGNKLYESLKVLADIHDDPYEIVKICNIKPERFARFITEYGLENNHHAKAILEAALSMSIQDGNPVNDIVDEPVLIVQASGMKELVEYIARSIVNTPDAVVVSEEETEQGITLEIQVADIDIGRVIGKQGCITKAMHTLVQVKAAKVGRRAIIEIVGSRQRKGEKRQVGRRVTHEVTVTRQRKGEKRQVSRRVTHEVTVTRQRKGEKRQVGRRVTHEIVGSRQPTDEKTVIES